jgi:hypothetical protein
MLVCFFICTQGCGCVARPAFPAPFDLRARHIGKPRTHGAARMRRLVIARSNATKQSIHHPASLLAGLLRGACHRARIRATRWLAMTAHLSSSGLTGRSSIPEPVMIKSISRGVLDTPPSRSMTTYCGAALCAYPSNTASAPLTASALSITVRSSAVACTVMFSAKNLASVT